MINKLATSLLVFALCLGTGSQPLLAQENPAPPPAADAAATEADASVAAVADLTSQTLQLLDETRSVATPRDDIVALKQKLQQTRSDLTQQSRELQQLLKDRPRPEQIQSLRQQWQFVREELATNQRTVQLRVDELEAALKNLQATNERWEAIKTQIREGKLPAETRKPVSRAQDDIAALRRTLNNTLREAANQAFEWQELTNLAEDVLGSIKKNEVTQRSALLSDLQPPLWTMTLADLHIEDFSSDWLQKQLKLLGAYLDKKRAGVITLLVISISVLVVMLRMRKRPETYLQLREGHHLRFALTERPFSTTAACAAALGILMLTNQPRLLRVFFALLMFLPLVRLGIPLMPPRQRPLVWHISVLYLINILATLTASVSAIERVVFILLSAAALVSVVFAIRGLPSSPPQFAGAWRALRATLWVSGPIAASAFIAGIVGAVALSELLISSLVTSAYIGLSLIVIVGIISDLLTTMLHTPAMQRINMVRSQADLIATRLRRLVGLAAALSWLTLVSNQFLVSDLIWHTIKRTLNEQATIGNISVSLGDVLAMGLTIWLSFLLSRFIRFVFNEEVVPRTHMQRGVPTTVSTLLHYVVVLIGFFAAIGAAGIDLSKVAILAGAMGVGIGIGLQDVVNNFTSGLILMFENHIKAGDVVQSDALSGKVVNIGLRCSIVRSFEGAEIVVPNSKLVSAQVINWTRSDQSRRLAIPVGVAYGTDPTQVMATLKEIAANEPDVMQDPEPNVLFLRFGASSLDFELRCWVSTGEVLMEVNTRLCTAISRAFTERGIEIPFPQQDVHLRSIAPQVVDAFTAARPRPASDAAG